MTVLFILPSLRAGGAERIVLFLAKQFSKKENYNVHLLVVGSKIDARFDFQDLNVTFLNKARLSTGIRAVWVVIQNLNPDIVFTSHPHINQLMAVFSLFKRNTRFIFREASVLSVMSNFGGVKSKLVKWLSFFTYSRATFIVCQSNDMKADLLTNFNLPEKKLIVINNPITRNLKEFTPKEKNNKCINFITIGRLSEEKGHERILKGLSNIQEYDFIYQIIGTGKLKKDLVQLIKKLGMASRVQFINYTPKVLEHLINADYFLQGSYVEGFPNSLLESCSVGTPVIAFNCPGGTKEIVNQRVNGILIENEKEFKEILLRVPKLYFDREKIIKAINRKFLPDDIIGRYENMFNKI